MKLLFAASLILVGCASLVNTPAQEHGLRVYENCRHLLPSDARLMRIDPDGKIWILGATGRGEFFACYRRGG